MNARDFRDEMQGRQQKTADPRAAKREQKRMRDLPPSLVTFLHTL